MSRAPHLASENRGEDLACARAASAAGTQFLPGATARGWRNRHRRARRPTLVFVEVKTRRRPRSSATAAEAVTGGSSGGSSPSRSDYLARHRLDDCRLPVRRRRRFGSTTSGPRSRCIRTRSIRHDALTDVPTAACLNCEKIPSPAAGSSSPPSGASARATSALERPSVIGARASARSARATRSMTPPEVLAYRRNGGAPNGPGWDVRVVPNKFPALQVEGDARPRGRGAVRPDERHRRARGDHRDAGSRRDAGDDVGEPEIERVLWAFRERVLDLKQDIAVPLHPGLQEPRRRGRRDARALALAAHRAADRAATSCARRSTARGGTSSTRSAASSATSSGRSWTTGARVISRERRLRRAGAVRAAVSVRDVAAAAAPRRRGSRRRRGTSTRAWRGC